MIIDNIKYCEKYFKINENFETAFGILKEIQNGASFEKTEKNGVRCTVSKLSETSDFDKDGNQFFEAHKKAIDIHFIIEGEEDMGVGIIDDLDPVCDYDEKLDYRLYKGHVSRVNLKKGDFIIAFPEDAHIPAMVAENEKSVKRAIVKISL